MRWRGRKRKAFLLRLEQRRARGHGKASDVGRMMLYPEDFEWHFKNVPAGKYWAQGKAAEALTDQVIKAFNVDEFLVPTVFPNGPNCRRTFEGADRSGL